MKSLEDEVLDVGRGYMDILIRIELAKDAHFLRDSHVREDRYISNWIKKKGLHDGTVSRRYMNLKRLLRRFLLWLPKSFINYLFTHHWSSTRNRIEWNPWWLLGILF